MRLSPAQRDEITAIRDRNNGRVLPEEVVRFASDPATALHSAFTWDNARAARDHRLDQARRLIAVYVTVIRVQGRTIQVRPFFSNPQIRQQLGVRSGYADISMIRGNAQLELSIMADMLKQAKGMLTHYGAFPAMRRLVAEFIENVEAQKLRMESANLASQQREQRRVANSR